MNYKILLFIILIFLSSCTNVNYSKKESKSIIGKKFSNKGFSLIYNNDLVKNKIIKSKIDDRSLVLFQKDLIKDSNVKITNLINSKYTIATVGSNVDYPSFYNSVISLRIAEELEIDILEPYIEIKLINTSETFIAKKSKTFDEEKQVANKAPVDSISINDLNKNSKKNKITKKDKFSYSIKIADFYFIENAKVMLDKVKKESKKNVPKIKKISKNQYRVFLGPFDNLNSLKIAFNDINTLNFENIDFIKNDKKN